jgi:hypothetical protein
MTVNYDGHYLRPDIKVVPIHAVGAHRSSSCVSPLVLNLSTTWRSWPTWHANRFTPTERTPRNWWTEGWVGPRASLDIMKKRYISWPCRDQTPDHPACRPVTALTMQFHLLRPDTSTWSNCRVIAEVTWHPGHSTYIPLSETTQVMCHTILNLEW